MTAYFWGTACCFKGDMGVRVLLNSPVHCNHMAHTVYELLS